MFNTRRLLRLTSVAAVALAAGHFVQTAKEGRALAKTDPIIPGIVRITPQPSPVLPASAALTGNASKGADQPDVTDIVAVSASSDKIAGSADAQDKCRATLDVTPAPDATLSVNLIAPCSKGQRIVIRHAGLTFTVRTSADGGFSTVIPALETEALVSVFFPDSEVAIASVVAPDADKFQRFGLQWNDSDSIDLRVSEDGKALPPSSLMLFGDTTVAQPMFAEIYTYPPDPAVKVDVLVEVAISESTCGLEMFAETINSRDGRISIDDVKVNVPACDVSGDILVLKNLAPDMKIAVAN